MNASKSYFFYVLAFISEAEAQKREVILFYTLKQF